MALGQAIATYRKLRGWTQSELAEKLDVHQTQIAHWEKERSKPRQENLERLAEAFEVSSDELTTGGPQSFNEISDPDLKSLLTQVDRLSEKQQEALKTILKDMLQISRLQEMMESRKS